MMASPTTVNRVKTDRRFRHNALDNDIADTIDSCLADLRVNGVRNPNEADPLIWNAIKLFCRANYAEDPAEASDYMARYDSMKATLMVAAGYGGDPT